MDADATAGNSTMKAMFLAVAFGLFICLLAGCSSSRETPPADYEYGHRCPGCHQPHASHQVCHRTHAVR